MPSVIAQTTAANAYPKVGYYLAGSQNFQSSIYCFLGKVDIIVKIEDTNNEGINPSSIYRNNGIYIAGYRIWSADTTSIVYEPDDFGMKYKFDRQPGNSYVHQVFVQGVATLSNPIYILTNGNTFLH